MISNPFVHLRIAGESDFGKESENKHAVNWRIGRWKGGQADKQKLKVEEQDKKTMILVRCKVNGPTFFVLLVALKAVWDEFVTQ